MSSNDEDAIADIIDQHDHFVGFMQTRFAKLQVSLDLDR